MLPILQTGGADCHAIFECRGARGHLNVNRGFHAPPRPTLAPLPLSQDSEGEAIEPAETKIGIFSAGGGFTAAHNSSVATETPSSVARRRPTFMMAREPAVKDPHAYAARAVHQPARGYGQSSSTAAPRGASIGLGGWAATERAGEDAGRWTRRSVTANKIAHDRDSAAPPSERSPSPTFAGREPPRTSSHGLRTVSEAAQYSSHTEQARADRSPMDGERARRKRRIRRSAFDR